MPFSTQPTFLSQNSNHNHTRYQHNRTRRPYHQFRRQALQGRPFHQRNFHQPSRTPYLYNTNARFDRAMNMMRDNVRMLQDREAWMQTQREVNVSRERARRRFGPMRPTSQVGGRMAGGPAEAGDVEEDWKDGSGSGEEKEDVDADTDEDNRGNLDDGKEGEAGDVDMED